MASINKELSRVERVVAAWDRVRCRREEIESLTSVLRDLKSEDDEELRAMASAERDDVERDVREIEERLALLLLPRDDADDATGAVLEVRAGAGGDEAALFAADLLKMYELHAKRRGWRFEMLSCSRQESGGYREAAASFEAPANGERVDADVADSAYAALRFESGVHRVQRVPVTETQGRVHTSTASVAVLPQLDELDVDGLVREEDVRVDTMRASGAGGQHVNTTNSAVRLTHVPTNTVVVCQDERSQHKNKDKAFKVLRARVYEAKRLEQHASRADHRRGLIGSGDRSERVRTYNFKEGRVKDHRVNHLSNDLEGFLSGGDALREMLDVLEREDRKRRLEEFEA
jgi:peptide chain release factor 1